MYCVCLLGNSLSIKSISSVNTLVSLHEDANVLPAEVVHEHTQKGNHLEIGDDGRTWLPFFVLLAVFHTANNNC